MSAPSRPDITHPHDRLRRLRRVIAAGAVVAGSFAGVAATSSTPVQAAQAALPTNALADVVSTSARQALQAHDAWTASQDPADYRTYVWYRTQTAQWAATELGYPQQEMVAAWSQTTIGHQRAVLAAMTQVGVPYRYNTSSEGVGFDCSGLTTFAWAAAGVPLTRQSSAQIREAAPIDRSTAKAGDLVQYPGHVMMYLGVGDAIIHSVMTGRTVELDTISDRRVNSVRFGDPIA